MRRRHQQLGFEGSIHFITVVTSVRGHWFYEEQMCSDLLSLFERCRDQYNLKCYGYVLMPDHLHALIVQSVEGDLVPALMNAFKKWSSRRYSFPAFNRETLWRRSYDDVPVPGRNAAVTKIEYMHNNPVRRGLVEQSKDYRWSSIHDYLADTNGIVTVEKI